MTRDQWLKEIATGLQPLFLEIGEQVPNPMLVNYGAVPYDPVSQLAEDISSEVTDAATRLAYPYDTWITPLIDNAEYAAAIVAHELIHQIYPVEGHGNDFKRVHDALELGGKYTSSKPTPKFLAKIQPVLDRLGPYPEAVAA